MTYFEKMKKNPEKFKKLGLFPELFSNADGENNHGTFELDVIGVGNAIVDRLAQVSESVVYEASLEKGAMTLVDLATASKIADLLEGESKHHVSEVSGGSAANTMVGLAGFGVKTGFVGRVSNDRLGKHFVDDLNRVGVKFVGLHPDTQGIKEEKTGVCNVLVTKDADRTMATYLGISSHLDVEDLEDTLKLSTKTLYLEGYLLDSESGQLAIQHAIKTADDRGIISVLSLSDPFVVSRYSDLIRKLVFGGEVGIIFANEDEIKILTQTSSFEEAVQVALTSGIFACLTEGSKGATVVVPRELSGDSEARLIKVPADSVDSVVDTTGAGDLFAAGFLAGLLNGKDLKDCARLGTFASGHVISTLGARPTTDLKELGRLKGVEI